MRKEERAEACRAMLARNHTYAEISHVLKMSSATIAAIARGEPGYKEDVKSGDVYATSWCLA